MGAYNKIIEQTPKNVKNKFEFIQSDNKKIRSRRSTNTIN